MNTVSSWVRIKCAIVFIVFMIFSVGPIPITSTIGLLVVIFRPIWFKTLVDNIYSDKDG
jgi:type III secretory pathway component EscS